MKSSSTPIPLAPHQQTQQLPPSAPSSGGSSLEHPVLRSSDLLQGRASVAIEHHGVLYRLHNTKLGKLILTK